MAAGRPESTRQVMPAGGNAQPGRGMTRAGRGSSTVVAIDARRQMAEMEKVLGAADQTQQMEALAALRRWQSDPTLDNASRQRARALVWKFQPNGWDEV